MLIGLISDTHLPRGRRRLPEACLECLGGCDLIVHAGDFVCRSVLDELEALGPEVVAVCGNQDCERLRARLPTSTRITASGSDIAVVHDAGPARGRLERLRKRFAGARAVVFGHSHIPLHACDDEFQIFNPGSPTDRRRAAAHTMGLCRAESGLVRFWHLALD